MDLFLFLVVTILISVLIFSFLLPTPLEEEEEEHWDSTEFRLESLLQGVMDPRFEIRERYQNRILSMGPGVIPRLTQLLSQELFLSQNETRILRLQELLLDFGLRALPVLLNLLEEEGEDPLVAEGVVELLQQMGTSVLPMVLERAEPKWIHHVIPLMREWGEPALKRLFVCFAEQPKKTMWEDALLAFGDDVVPALNHAVDTWEGEKQERAFRLLTRLASVRSRPLFLKALSHESALWRSEAVGALSKMDWPEKVEVLRPLLQEPEQVVRLRVIEALSELREPSLREEFLSCLEKTSFVPPSLKERLLLEFALARLGEPVQHKSIEAALESRSRGYRLLGLELIPFLSSDEAFLYYETLLWDSDSVISTQVIGDLAMLRSVHSVSLLLEFLCELPSCDPRYDRVREALKDLGGLATQPLLRLLSKRERSLRSLALSVLLQGHDLEAVEPTLTCVSESEEPALDFGIEPEELLLFLRRVAEFHPELERTLREFAEKYPSSSLAPALREFIATLSCAEEQSNTSLALGTNTPEV